jgi:hypothetical protein
MTSDGQRSIKAHYASPKGTHTFQLQVNAPCSTNPTTSERTAYLSALRANTKQLQADVNKFLTEKMEEDKAHAGAAAGKDSKKQDELEEQNYGEEQAEDAD